MFYQVWANRIKKGTDKYTYSYHFGNRPTQQSFLIGELIMGYNPETGQDTEYHYSSNGRYPQPSYNQTITMENSVN